MITLLAILVSFIAGMLFEQNKAKVAAFVGVVFGKRPKAAAPDGHVAAAPVVENPNQRTPTIGTALKNLGGFFVGAFTWCLKHPMLAISLVVLALWLVLGSPFEFGKSKEQLRLENELAQSELRVRELETERDAEIADISRDVAVIRNQIRAESQRGHDEISAATPLDEAPIDLQLSTAWRNSLERMRNACANAASAYPCGSEPTG